MTGHDRIAAACWLILVLAMTSPLRSGETSETTNWPQWRGPSGDGVAAIRSLPLHWGPETGLAWTCALPEWGDSTPVIWNDAIFVTSQVEDRDLVLIKIDKPTGRIEWTRRIGQGSTTRAKPLHKSGEDRGQTKFHATQNLATPSPVTDGQRVIAHFGNGDLAAVDFKGNTLWKRNLQEDESKYSIWWGHANSPVLFEGLVISVCMQDSCRDLGVEPFPSYVVAHDVQTGQRRWKTLRMTSATGEHCDSYTTPILWSRNGRKEMIVMGGQMLDAYDPLTGKQLWSMPELIGNRVIPTPVAGPDTIYAIQGMRESLIAIRPKGDGVRPTSEIAWSSDKGTSDSPSPVLCDGLLFMVNNEGILQCFQATDGVVLWKQRLPGSYRASPVVSGSRLFLLNTVGVCTVVAVSRKFERLAENRLDDETFASPAISDGRIYLRGRKAIYCIERSKTE